MSPRMHSTVPQAAAKVETKASPTIDLESIAEASQKRYDAGRFAPKDEDALWRLAETWYFSGLLPAAYYPPENSGTNARYEKGWSERGISRAVIVMRYGASLGVLPEQAIRLIYIVEGQPSPAAALMLALAFSSGLLRRDDWRLVESSAKKVVVEMFGRSRAKPELITVQYDDYKHLHSKTNWKNYPEDMLVARATSRAMRRYFPDMFAGVYAAEERVDFRTDRTVAESVERILAAVDEPAHEETPPPVTTAPEAQPVEAQAPAVDRSLAAFVKRCEAITAADLMEGSELRAWGAELAKTGDAAAAREAYNAAKARVSA